MLAADEKSISGEDSLVVSVLHEETNAVLGMAGRVDSPHSDVTQLKGLTVARRIGDTLAVLASDNVQLGSSKFSELAGISEISRVRLDTAPYQLLVTSCMVPMTAAGSVCSKKDEGGCPVLTDEC